MFFTNLEASNPLNLRGLALACEYAHTAITLSENTVRDTVYPSGNVMTLGRQRLHAPPDPGIWIWQSPELRIIAIAGARSPVDQANAIAGWNQQASPFKGGGVNRYAWDWYTSILMYLDQYVTLANNPSQQTWFAGFSWGGTAVTLLARRYNNHSAYGRCTSVTFGTPRYATTGSHSSLTPYLAIRLMTTGDPLPFLVPQLSEAPGFYAGAPLLAYNHWSRYSHLAGGAELKRDGSIVPAVVPSGVDLPIDWYFGRWVAANIPEDRRHAIWTYRQWLEQAYPYPVRVTLDPAAMTEARGHTDRTADQEERPASPSPVEVNRAVREVMRHRQKPRNVPPAGPAILSRPARIVTRKNGPTWTVYCDQTEVYAATSRRDAKAVANALRALLLQWRQQPDLWATDDIISLFREGA